MTITKTNHNQKNNFSLLQSELEKAIKLSSVDLVNYWIRRGANPNGGISVQTLQSGMQHFNLPLHLALEMKAYDIVRALVVGGANPFTKDSSGQNAFDVVKNKKCSKETQSYLENFALKRFAYQPLSGQSAISRAQDKLIEKILNLVAKEPDYIMATVHFIKRYFVEHALEEKYGERINVLLDLLSGIKGGANYFSVQERYALEKSNVLNAQSPLFKNIKAMLSLISLCMRGLPQEDVMQPVISALGRLRDFHSQYVERLCVASMVERKRILECVSTVTGHGIGVYSISAALARELTCRGEYGEENKGNSDGNHPVVGKAGVHYKPNPEGRDYIEPGYSHIANTQGELIEAKIGAQIIAPVTIIKIDGVPVTKPLDLDEGSSVYDASPEKKEAFLQYSGLLREGKSPGEIFQENPKLRQLIPIKNEVYGRVMQASYTAFGMPLKNIIGAHQLLDHFNKRIESSQLSQVFADLLNEGPYKRLVQQNQQLVANLTVENIIALYKRLLPKVQDNLRIKEFQGLEKIDDQGLLIQFNGMLADTNLKDLVNLLAIVTTYPQLMFKTTLKDILEMPKYLRVMRKLFPKSDSNAVWQKINNVWKLLDIQNFGAIFFWTLYTNPSDGKGDNYMVLITRDSNGEVVKLEIVAIDNDKVLANPVTRIDLTKYNQGIQNNIGVKTLIYYLPAMKWQIHPSVRNVMRNYHPLLLMLDWLAGIGQLDPNYQRSLDSGWLTPDDVEDENGEAALDTPTKLVPEMMGTIYKSMLAVYNLLQKNESLTYEALLKSVQPAVFFFYEAMLKFHPSLRTAFFNLHKEENSIGEVLDAQKRLELQPQLQDVNVRPSDYETMRTQRFNDALSDFAEKNINFPSLKPNIRAQLLDMLGKQFNLFRVLQKPDVLQAWLIEAISFGKIFAVDLLLRSGVNVNFTYQSKNIIIHVIHVAKTISALPAAQKSNAANSVLCILEALLASEALQIKSYGDSLFSLIEIGAISIPGSQPGTFYDLRINIFKHLIRAGLELNAKKADTYETPLDFSMKRDDVIFVGVLINSGVRLSINPIEALSFFSRYEIYLKNNAGDQVLSKQLLQKLVTQSSDLRWHIMLSETLEPSSGSTQSQGEVVSVRYGNKKLPQTILSALIDPKTGKFRKSQKELKEEEEYKQYLNTKEGKKDKKKGVEKQLAQYGSRSVIGTDFKGYKVHWKQRPESSGMQYMAELLYKLVFSDSAATESELFKRCDNGDPIQATRTLEGYLLLDVLQGKPVSVNGETLSKQDVFSRIDRESFFKSVIMAMITRTEDGKADNYYIEVIMVNGKLSFRIAEFDMDRGFGDTMSEEGGKRKVKLKCILFLFDMMLEVIPDKVIQHFKAVDAEQLLKEYLTKLQLEQNRHGEIFSVEERLSLYRKGNRKSLFKKTVTPIFIGIPLVQGEVTRLYLLIESIKAALRPGITGLELLKKIYPELGSKYSEAHKENTVSKRFETLVSGVYKKETEGYYGTNTGLAIESHLSTSQTEALVKGFDMRERFGELNEAVNLKKNLVAKGADLLKGDHSSFRKLHSQSSRELVLAGIDFKSVSKSQQLTLFKTLGSFSWTKLTLRNAAELTYSKLSGILKRSKSTIVSLDISGCVQMKDSNVKSISKDYKNLRRLNISGIDFVSLELVFFQLQKLVVDDVKTLQRVKVEGPLTMLEINNASALVSLVLTGGQLERLSLNGASKLDPECIVNIVEKSPDLKDAQFNSARPDFLRVAAHKIIAIFYRNGLLTPQNMKSISQIGVLNLDGLNVTDAELMKFVIYATEYLSEVSVANCPYITVRSLTRAIAQHSGLNKIKVSLPLNANLKENVRSIGGFNTSTIHDMAVMDGRVLLGGYHKSHPVLYQDSAGSTHVVNFVDRSGKSSQNGAFSWVRSVTFLANSNFVTGSENGKLFIWSWDEKRSCAVLQQQLQGHRGMVECLAAHSSSRLYSGGGEADSTIKIWDLKLMRCVTTLTGHSGLVKSLLVMSDLMLVSAANDKEKNHFEIRVWNLSQLQCVHAIKVVSPVYCLVKIQDGLFAAGHKNGAVSFYDVSNPQASKVIDLNLGTISSMTLMPGRKLVIATGTKNSGQLTLVSLDTGKFQSLTQHSRPVNAVALDKGLLFCAGVGLLKSWRRPPNEVSTINIAFSHYMYNLNIRRDDLRIVMTPYRMKNNESSTGIQEYKFVPPVVFNGIKKVIAGLWRVTEVAVSEVEKEGKAHGFVLTCNEEQTVLQVMAFLKALKSRSKKPTAAPRLSRTVSVGSNVNRMQQQVKASPRPLRTQSVVYSQGGGQARGRGGFFNNRPRSQTSFPQGQNFQSGQQTYTGEKQVPQYQGQQNNNESGG